MIQIPLIQTKIVQTATTFVTNKTHTKFELKKLSISLPKSIVVEGLYAVPLRKPWMEENHSWVIDQMNFGNSEWQNYNMVLNVANGYPF
jgi:hypothetical protein